MLRNVHKIILFNMQRNTSSCRSVSDVEKGTFLCEIPNANLISLFC